MSGKFHERRVFPSGDFDRMPTIGTVRRRPLLRPSSLGWLGAGAMIGALLQAIAQS